MFRKCFYFVAMLKFARIGLSKSPLHSVKCHPPPKGEEKFQRVARTVPRFQVREANSYDLIFFFFHENPNSFISTKRSLDKKTQITLFFFNTL